MEAVLRIAHLGKAFGGKPALSDVSFEVEPGEVFGLVGPDGAGKTTCLRMAAGLLTPDAGEITALGFRIPRERRRLSAQLGYMPQMYSLYGDLSVQENLRFFAGMLGVTGALEREREKRLLEMSLLERFRERPARALSGGMYKKLALCCALIHQPRLLLLDEPTNGVDPISRRELWAFLHELLGSGVAVVVCTPYMDEAERCARVGLLRAGRLAAVESPTALIAGFELRVVELELEPVPGAADPLLHGVDIDDGYLVGRLAHVLVRRSGPSAADMAARAQAAGFVVKRAEEVKPSFEDVFLQRTREDAP